MNEMSDLMRKAILKRLGLCEDLPFAFVLYSHGVISYVRVPPPDRESLDMLPEDDTCDIIGKGFTPEDALQDAASTYRAREQVFYSLGEGDLTRWKVVKKMLPN
ncbi:MAG TPA: hypothetical protein VFP46_02350 [Candidatus Paceibacterota bacterium]|nr:hypothetical protein [Candidatus Paceibacterota bacterium]